MRKTIRVCYSSNSQHNHTNIESKSKHKACICDSRERFINFVAFLKEIFSVNLE